MKTREEFNIIKEEVETVNKKLHELTDDELAQVSGGVLPFSDETVFQGSSSKTESPIE